MSTRTEIERRIEKKQDEINGLERAIGEAKSYIQALQDTLKLLPRDGNEHILASRSLRRGSEMEKVRALLLKTGKPLYIEDILKGLGKEITRDNRNAIAGSLSGYTRRGEIFTRPEPGTFGLVEFSTQEPPEGFGEGTPAVP
jgi:predicted RNase H-like nuclease (RuvC/YqgF family)